MLTTHKVDDDTKEDEKKSETEKSRPFTKNMTDLLVPELS